MSLCHCVSEFETNAEYENQRHTGRHRQRSADVLSPHQVRTRGKVVRLLKWRQDDAHFTAREQLLNSFDCRSAADFRASP